MKEMKGSLPNGTNRQVMDSNDQDSELAPELLSNSKSLRVGID